ncbi:MAG: hypothetical protein KC609_23670 [Myxococcales bacterium]|nr:hypothetical protein [Myxococcales bacterium]
MRALLVTSELTYIPENYVPLFDEVLEGAGEHVVGLMLLDVVSPALAKTIAGLFAMGAPRIASTLTRNLVELPRARRERLFARRGLHVLRAQTMNDPWVIEWLLRERIDLVVNLRTRCIYRKRVLAAPRLGCINLHHGMLPRYRGTMCDLWALADRRPAGFSIHRMTRKVDDGELLCVEETSPGGERDYLAHLTRASRVEGRAVARVLQRIATDDAIVGEPNRCDNPIYTQTPQTFAEIRALRAKGLRL